MQIVLASQSPNRLDLLNKIGIIPNIIAPADLDETPFPNEKPNSLALRLAIAKAEKIAKDYADNTIIIGADTIVSASRKMLPKAETKEDIKFCLKKLSGRRHRVYTGVCIIKTGATIIRKVRLAHTILKFKRLTDEEIENYADLGEGLNKAGGYSIQGYAQSFAPFIGGEISTVIGLPLFETRNMLISIGLKV